jgi:integrase
VVDYLDRRRARNPDDVYLFDDGSGNPAYADAHALTRAISRHKAELGQSADWKPLQGMRVFSGTSAADDAGLAPFDVQSQLGHRSFATTERNYLASHSKSKRRAATQLEARVLRPMFGPRLGRRKKPRRKAPGRSAR